MSVGEADHQAGQGYRQLCAMAQHGIKRAMVALLSTAGFLSGGLELPLRPPFF